MSENDTSYIDYFKNYKEVRKSLFLDGKIGLIENLRNEFPEIWSLYKQLKRLDWDEREIDISSCRAEFNEVPKEIYDLMIKTLAWQFEADSSAAHFAEIMLPFTSSSELLCYVLEVSKNEALHSLAYKVIVEYSFDNPNDFLDELLSIKESFKRLDVVKKVFDDTYKLSHQYALGLVTDEKLIRKAILKFIVSLLALERIQFISSFAITFGIAEQGHFIPIAKLVQKICTDEFQIHVQGDKSILNIELDNEDIFVLYLEIIDEVKAIVDEVIESELTWLDYLFQGDSEKYGMQKERIKQFVLFNGQDVYDFLNIELPYERIETNPLPYMDNWIVIDKNQASPQEENVANYLLGGYIDNSSELKDIELTFLK
jgi:ribonucleoside-diphosphate reductase beta chain